MSKRIHFLNGEFVTEDKLLISPRDVGFSRGYAVFDFLITYPHHRPFLLERHIDRLFRSADLIKLEIPLGKQQVKQWVFEALEQNDSAEEKFIKIIVSGGISNTMLPGDVPTIVILIDPRYIYPKELYEKGSKVITVRHMRYIPNAKTNNYIEGVKQTKIGSKIGAIEPVYYNENQVFEGSNSNIFAVIDKKLLTPKSNILPGITREVLLEILSPTVPVEVKDFTIEQLSGSSEVFMTSSNKEVIPVTKIDDKKVGDGKVGKITKEAMRQFKEFTKSDTW